MSTSNESSDSREPMPSKGYVDNFPDPEPRVAGYGDKPADPGLRLAGGQSNNDFLSAELAERRKLLEDNLDFLNWKSVSLKLQRVLDYLSSRLSEVQDDEDERTKVESCINTLSSIQADFDNRAEI